MPQGGELPVQHGDDLGLLRIEHQVVQTVVTMNNTYHTGILRHGGDVLWKPLHQLVHFGNGLGNRGSVLLAPPANLPLEIIARFAIAGQSALGKLDRVQSGNDPVHFVVDGAALLAVHAR